MVNEFIEIKDQETKDDAVEVVEEVVEIIATPEIPRATWNWKETLKKFAIVGAVATVVGVIIEKTGLADKLSVKRLEKKGYVIYRPDELVEAEADSDYDDEIVNQDTTEE